MRDKLEASNIYDEIDNTFEELCNEVSKNPINFEEYTKPFNDKFKKLEVYLDNVIKVFEKKYPFTKNGVNQRSKDITEAIKKLKDAKLNKLLCLYKEALSKILNVTNSDLDFESLEKAVDKKINKLDNEEKLGVAIKFQYYILNAKKVLIKNKMDKIDKLMQEYNKSNKEFNDFSMEKYFPMNRLIGYYMILLPIVLILFAINELTNGRKARALNKVNQGHINNLKSELQGFIDEIKPKTDKKVDQ